MRPAAAILLAALAATAYAVSTMYQALEARQTSGDSSLRASLLLRLARRRTWVLGSAVGGVGWALQAVALSFASVALVQPALGLGLVVLLLLATRILGEAVGPREVGASLTVVVAVGVLGWAAPSHADHFTAGARVAIGVVGAVLFAAPHALRRAGQAGGLVTSVLSGLGWGWVGIATSLADRSLGHGHLLAAAVWAAGAGAVSWSSLVVGMSAYQVWPATRSWPVTFSIEMAAPAALAPILTHGGVGPAHGVPFFVALATACAGAVVLGSSRTVAHAVAP